MGTSWNDSLQDMIRGTGTWDEKESRCACRNRESLSRGTVTTHKLSQSIYLADNIFFEGIALVPI